MTLDSGKAGGYNKDVGTSRYDRPAEHLLVQALSKAGRTFNPDGCHERMTYSVDGVAIKKL